MSSIELNEDSLGLRVVSSASLAIKTACPTQWGGAGGLVARRYAARGYVCSDLSTHLESNSVVVCSAFDGPSTVGTIAVRFDAEQGLNADLVFAAELQQLRASGTTLCEFGRLALDEQVGDNKQLLARLFHLAYLHAHRLAGCETLVIEVNPRHAPFYRRMLGFKPLGEPRMNPRVNAPAVLMCLDLEYAREQIACFGGQAAIAASTRTLYPYFYGAEEERAMLVKLRQ